jgi:urease
VTVHDPICHVDVNLEAALYGSFLPIPNSALFPIDIPHADDAHRQPGAIIPAQGRIEINAGRERVQLRVINNGDRPIQVRAFIQGTWTIY